MHSYRRGNMKTVIWLLVFVVGSRMGNGAKKVTMGIMFYKLSQTEYEIIQNATSHAKSHKGASVHLQYFFVKCSEDRDLLVIGNEIHQRNTSIVISIGCSKNFIDFLKLIRIPVVSLARNSYSEEYQNNSKNHLQWRRPATEEFSNAVNRILLRQDWYEIVVLYDANDYKAFRDYMRSPWTIGSRKGYPLEVKADGTLNNSSMERLKVFANFSIHAVVLLCSESHLQPIVNMIKKVNRSGARVVPALVLHNPVDRPTLRNALSSQTVIGLRVNYTLYEITEKEHLKEILKNDTFGALLSHAMYSTAEGVLDCAANHTGNESLQQFMYNNIKRCIKQEANEYQLDIMNLRNDTFVQVGSANDKGKAIELWSLFKVNKLAGNYLEQLGRPLRVVTIHDPPFVWIDKLENGTKVFRGFLVDIFKEIQKHLNFEYTMYEVEDDEYGSLEDGKWIGMVGDVFYDKADFALAPFTVDEIRSQIITFLQPFMKAHVAYLMKRQETTTTSVTQFLEPFTTNVWLTIFASIFITTLAIYFVDFVGPNGWRQWRLEREGKPGHQFDLFNSLWFTMGCLLRQGTYISPRSFPSRILVAVFWFIVLIQMSSYTANLAAYFTSKKATTNIQDLETLAKMDYNILIFKYSVIHKQLEYATYQPYKMIYEKIEAHNAFVHLFEEGVAKIRNSTERTTILLSESPFLEDIANKQPCDLVSVNSFLPVRSYAFVVQFNSLLYDTISVEIAKLQDSGFIEAKRKVYWDFANQCKWDSGESDNGYGRITAMQMTGVYAVLLGGIVLSIITFILEIFWKHRQIKKKNKKISLQKQEKSEAPNHREIFESSFVLPYEEELHVGTPKN